LKWEHFPTSTVNHLEGVVEIQAVLPSHQYAAEWETKAHRLMTQAAVRLLNIVSHTPAHWARLYSIKAYLKFCESPWSARLFFFLN